MISTQYANGSASVFDGGALRCSVLRSSHKSACAFCDYWMCSSGKSSRTRMPMSSRVPVGNRAIPVLSYLLTRRLAGSRRGFAPVTSGPWP